MRHGQTNYNLLGLCNDDPACDVHLTATGVAQAEAAARQLATVPLERIIVSPLPRTHQTAAVINRGRDLPVDIHPGIHDWRTGLNNRPVAELYAQLGDRPLDRHLPGGETLGAHRRRVLDFLDWLEAQPQRHILVVAHEETLRVVAGRYRRLGDADMLALKFGNAEILRFEV